MTRKVKIITVKARMKLLDFHFSTLKVEASEHHWLQYHRIHVASNCVMCLDGGDKRLHSLNSQQKVAV